MYLSVLEMAIILVLATTAGALFMLMEMQRDLMEKKRKRYMTTQSVTRSL